MGGAVRSAFGRVTAGAAGVLGGFRRMGSGLGGIASRMRASITSGMTMPLGGLRDTLRGMGPIAGLIGFGAVVTGAVRAASTIDNTRRTLTGLYGSAQQAGDMMQRLKTLSSNSPISYQAYAEASTQLAYMDIKGREAEGVLRNVGAAIVASGKGSAAMGQASQAMLQMVNSGRVYADQLNQISQAGVPVFSALATHFHTSIAQVREMVTKGKVGIQDVMASIRNAEGPTFKSMLAASKQVTGSMSNQWAMLKDNAQVALGGIALPVLRLVTPAMGVLARAVGRLPALFHWLAPVGAVFGTLGRAVLWLVQAALWPLWAIAKPIFTFLAGNRVVITFVSSALIGMATAFLLVRAALLAVQVATWLWNAAMAVSPIYWIIGLIVGLVAVVIYCWQNFAWFRNIVTACWNGIKVAAQAVWSYFLQPIFNAIVVAIGWVIQHWQLLAGIIGILLGPIGWVGVAVGFLALHWRQAWNIIATAAVWLWNTVLHPIFNAISFGARLLAAIIITILVTPLVLAWRMLAAAAIWLWNAAIHPVFTWIGGLARWLWVNALAPAFRGIAWVFRWLYTAVILPVGHFIGAVFTWLYRNVVLPVCNYIKAGLRAWGAVFTWLYRNVVLPVGHFIANIFRWLWANVINPTCTYIKAGLRILGNTFRWVYDNVIHPVWTALGNAIRWVWVNVIRPAFNAIKAAVAAVGRAFDSAVNFIQRVWNKIKAIAAKPINFVINTVYNHGIKAVWDKVAGFLGLGKLPAAKPVRWATGGHVTGPGSGTSDEIPAMLSNGEFVVREKIARFARPFLTALNAGNGEALQATGGPRVRPAKRESFARNAVGLAAGGPAEQRINQAKRFLSGPARGIPYVYGGGTSKRGTDCSGMQAMVVHLLSGRSPWSGRLGSTASMPWSGFRPGLKSAYAIGNKPGSHMASTLAGQNVEQHGPGGTPFRFPSRWGADNGYFTQRWHLPVVGGQFVSGGSGGGGGFVSWIVNKILDPLRGLIKRTLPERPLWKSMPRGASLKLVDGVANWLSAKDTSGGGPGAPGKGPVVAQVRGVANGYGWGQGPQWDALSWLISHESSWDPSKHNPTSSAAGLFQKMQSVHGRVEPTAAQQARWGLAYIKRTYGSPTGAKRFWQGHHWYDEGGVLPPGVSLAVNGTGQDEMVLTRRQWQALEANVRGGDEGRAPLVFNATYHVDKSPEEHAAATSRALARRVRELS